MMYVFIVLSAISLISVSLACTCKHQMALKNLNMVRYKSDIIKRKDIVRIKKRDK